ncbi:MAG: enoyl-CoA hydratase/isomerase family protein [Dehalococcoidia bacterium]|nr:enoyl-CoA hydratase/isomerase family protein [Dehalococcoidia bacterium]
MSYETVLYESSEHIATITLNRPDALNSFNTQLRNDLDSALKEAEGDDEVRCVILTGAGKAFSAGADVKGWGQTIQQGEQAAEAPSLLVLPNSRPVSPLTEFLLNMSKPIIAAINGAAVGMGATIPVACDLRTAAESGRFAFAFAKRGVTPEYGSTFLLPRLVGWGKARELCMTGNFIGARDARAIGLVNEVYPDEQFMASTRALALSIAANPPVCIKFIKRGFNMAMDSSLPHVLAFEYWALDTCRNSDDYKEGVRAFIEKRPAVFKGR